MYSCEKERQPTEQELEAEEEIRRTGSYIHDNCFPDLHERVIVSKEEETDK